ncbi:MAG: PHP domain-containing protein [Burkholderiales bacterium]|nr:PHP domain-containing protein [Anaerolineae bacterium]
MRCDLHLHTTASDGQLTPLLLVDLARQRGFDTIAITDHDTTGSILEAQAAGGDSLTVIPGVELSAEDDAGDVHTLGYCFDINNPEFQAEMQSFRDHRFHRGRLIVEKLAKLGVNLSWERVLEIADGGSIGRPHIARAMAEAGYVSSVKEAFDRYIANDGVAYVERKRISPEEAIQLIHSAGGVAVLAHPGLLKDPASMIERLAPAGLDGIELNHPKNSDEVREIVKRLTKRFGLLTTGGSDFHSMERDSSHMGVYLAPDEAVNNLRERSLKYG